MWESIADCELREGREGCPNLKHVLASVCSVLAASQGQPVDSTQEAAVKAEIIKTGTKAWLDDATFEAALCFVETPFRLNVTSRFDEDRVTIAASVNVSFGPTQLPELIGQSD